MEFVLVYGLASCLNLETPDWYVFYWMIKFIDSICERKVKNYDLAKLMDLGWENNFQSYELNAKLKTSQNQAS